MTTQEKINQLAQIAKEISNFKDLEIARTAHKSVPGEGNPDAEILFIGEAPGQVEDSTGRPFVGRSGQLMRTTLTETTGITPDQVFITNIVKYRPPDNRDPTPEEIAACRDWLDRQIDIIRPKIIVSLGRFSMAKFIEGVTISRIHGQPRFVEFMGGGYTLFPMYHPAAALRGGEVMSQFKKDFVKLQTLLEPAAKPVSKSVTVPDPSQQSLF